MKQTNFEKLKALVREILIDILIFENNQFEKTEYFAVSQFLWAVENYPLVEIPHTSIEITASSSAGYDLVVLAFEEDLIRLMVGGVEQTPHGSDSFEKISHMFFHDEMKEHNQKDPNFSMDNIFDWDEEAKALLNEEDCKITVEYYG